MPKTRTNKSAKKRTQKSTKGPTLLKLSNTRYETMDELKKHAGRIRDGGFADLEQAWVDTNLQPIIDLMGDNAVWKNLIADVECFGCDGGRASSRNMKLPTDHSIAIFSGSHWTSRKSGETEMFDPYDEYQIHGTNQFCQTYAMMYLMDALPPVIPSEGADNIGKYYEYTRAALEFIRDVVVAKFEFPSDYDRKYYRKCVNACIKNVNMCLNCVEVSRI
jgi:hypothetical protein